MASDDTVWRIAVLPAGTLSAPDGSPVSAVTSYNSPPPDGRPLKQAFVAGAGVEDGSPVTYVSYYAAGTLSTPDGRPVGAIILYAAPGGGGTALSAPTLTRTSGVSSYPMTVDFTRPIDWMDGDQGAMQRSQDPTFATGVSETINTLLAATTTYNFGLSAITSGIWYARMATWRGTRPASLNWSNIVGVGDAVAPAITSTASPTAYQFATGSLALTADKAGTWELAGGFDYSQFSITGSTLSWLAQPTTGPRYVQIRFTSLFGVATTQNITLTVNANAPAAFSFTPVTNATRSTQYTGVANVPISGIGAPPLPISVSGGWEYSIDGGASWLTAPSTVGNGPTPRVRLLSSGSYSTLTRATLSVGSVSADFDVTTGADPAAPAGFATSTGPNKHSSATVSGATNNVLTTAFSVGNQGARAVPASVSGDDIEYTVTVTGITTQDPLYIGVDDGAGNLSTYSGNPGGDAKCAVLNPFKDGGVTGTQILGDGYAIFQTAPANQPSGGLQNGDQIITRVKKSTGAVRFFHKRGAGAEAQVGTTATLSGMTAWHPRIAAGQAVTFTADFTLWGVP